MPLEWLIDIIKEWVIAQAYATEAWVTEWFTPYSVTGQLGPNATCLYFKAGTYWDRPYYRRQDGAWFIWWYGLYDSWVISVIVGGYGTAFWGRESTEVAGEYLPHLDATGNATVTLGYQSLCTSFVNRGDPANPDYTQATLTADGSWHELDLSSIVPDRAKAVVMVLRVRDDEVRNYLRFRRLGNINEDNVSELWTQVSNIFISKDLTIPLDENRKIEYNLQFTSFDLIWLTVKGWWF